MDALDIRSLSVGNAAISLKGKLIELNTTMLGQYQLWLTNEQKWQCPFQGIIITNLTLPRLGFVLEAELKTVIPEDLDYGGFENVHMHELGFAIGFKDNDWRLLTILFEPGNTILISQGSKPLMYIHEIQNNLFWVHGEHLDYQIDQNEK